MPVDSKAEQITFNNDRKVIGIKIGIVLFYQPQRFSQLHHGCHLMLAGITTRAGANEIANLSDTFKRRILAAFYKQEFDSYDTIDWTNYTTGIEDMMIEMGVPYEFPKNELIKKRNAEELQKYVMDAKEWFCLLTDLRYGYTCCSQGTYDSA